MAPGRDRDVPHGREHTRGRGDAGSAGKSETRFDAFFWGTVAMMAAGGAALIAGAITQCVAWIGALLNTFRDADKTWFVALLALGLLGFQFPAMIAYLVAGPDVQAGPPAWSPLGAPPLPPPLPPAINRQPV